MTNTPISRRTLLIALASMISIPITCEVGRTYYEYFTATDDSVEPMWWRRRTPRAIQAYAIADMYPELLRQLPCYCGCADFQYPHRNLNDCYHARGGGYEEHASLCRICQAETFDARDWHEAGVPAEEIRRRIDDQYSGVAPEFGPNGHEHQGSRRPRLTILGIRLF